MELVIYTACILVLLFVGYLVSVYTNAVYIQPDELKDIFPELSERRRRWLELFISDPRAFFQIGLIVRVSSSILLGMLAILMTMHLASYRVISGIFLYLVIPPAIWFLAALYFIYIPRRVTIRNVRAKLIRFLPMMSVFYLVLSPTLQALTRWSQRRPVEAISEEQKDDIVERAIETLAESAGISTPLIEEDEKEMIHQIFQLDVTEAEAIMVPRFRITGLARGTSFADVQKAVAAHGFSRYPVYDGDIDHIIGILYAKDLLLINEEARRSFSVTDYIREPLTVNQHKKIDQLLADFRKTKTHLAIVVDEFGGTAGLVTLEDILEEIVGEIEDEHSPAQPLDIVRLSDGSLEVSGACPLDDLAEALAVETEGDEFETVAGMIYDLVGSVPPQGIVLDWKNHRLTVLEVKGQRIARVHVDAAPPKT